MKNRALSLALAGLLTVGAVAGCSSKKSSSSPTTAGGSSSATTAAGSGGSSGGASSDKVKQYCDSVDAFVAKAKSAGTDPSKLQTLTKESQDLAAAATKVTAGLATDPNAGTIAQQVGDCSKKLATAFTPGG